MTLYKRLRTIAAKTEVTIGTPIALAAGDGAFHAMNPEIQPNIETEEREASGSMDRLKGVPGARGGTMTFRIDAEWDGTATLPDWADVLLPACGWVNSGGVFTPRSEKPGSNVKTLTMGLYEDGLFKSIAGAMGNFRLVMPTSKIVYFDFTFQGVWQAPSDVAIIDPTYPDPDVDKVIQFLSATAQYDSVDLCVNEIVFDSGNQIILRQCPTTAAGYISAHIVDRYPTVTADPEADLVANDDPYGDWLSSTEAALAVTLDAPSTATLGLSVPKAQIFNAQEGDRDKLQTDELEFRANKNGANKDQQASLTFTNA